MPLTLQHLASARVIDLVVDAHYVQQLAHLAFAALERGDAAEAVGCLVQAKAAAQRMAAKHADALEAASDLYASQARRAS